MAELSSKDWAGDHSERWLAHIGEMEAMLAPVDDPLVEALALDEPLRVADVGCGGGATTRKIAERAAAGSTVRGLDIAPLLVERARERAVAEGSSATFTVEDVSQPPQSADRYDRLTSRFGIMFFGQPETAFHNLALRLAPGGRFAFAAWADPAENFWVSTLREVVEQVVELPRPEPDAPGPFRYADGAAFQSLLERAGFRDVQLQQWRGVIPIGGGMNAADAAHFALSTFSAFADSLREAGEETTARAERLVAARLAEYESDGRVELDGLVHIVTGAGPE